MRDQRKMAAAQGLASDDNTSEVSTQSYLTEEETTDQTQHNIDYHDMNEKLLTTEASTSDSKGRTGVCAFYE